MTDHEVLSAVISCIDPSSGGLHVVQRNGRVLLGLPQQSDAAARALGLYQPQRPAARMLVNALRGMTNLGLQGCVLKRIAIKADAVVLSPPLIGVEARTCGVLLGSPEHRVRRAIASYQTAGGWEVAKVSFGAEGRGVLEQEARALEELQAVAAGIPALLGLHRGAGATVLRMPYLTGQAVPAGESREALDLLNGWVTDLPVKAITGFSEWPAIHSALSDLGNAGGVIERLSREQLRPVIRHGDFARWNLLKQPDGSLVVLDWEWGCRDGMPGIDLAHYFLQDARLVKRLPHADSIAETIRELNRPECTDYLKRTGWSGDAALPVIASLAWKQGAGQQENEAVLDVILNSEF